MTPAERRAPALDVAIGLMVQRARKSRSLSVGDFAELAGIEPTTLYRIERGTLGHHGQHVASWGLICELANALGMPVSTLVKMAEDRIYETPVTGPVELAL